MLNNITENAIFIEIDLDKTVSVYVFLYIQTVLALLYTCFQYFSSSFVTLELLCEYSIIEKSTL